MALHARAVLRWPGLQPFRRQNDVFAERIKCARKHALFPVRSGRKHFMTGAQLRAATLEPIYIYIYISVPPFVCAIAARKCECFYERSCTRATAGVF